MELTLPLLGDVMTEGTVAKWLIEDGASVRAGEPLYEVETDKVTMTVDAPVDGRLERVVVEGETVPVGAVVARLEAASPLPQVEGVRATPAARAAARRLGVDVRQIANGRRVREADVVSFAESAGGGATLSGRRKVIAERMRSSLLHTAQVTESMEVDMADALRLREQLKQLVGDERRPSITDLVIRAIVLALREHAVFNATFEGDRLRIHSEVHMGVAVDADQGLIVPVIRDVNGLDLLTLARRTREVVERARSNRLAPEDISGGTFTVTSLGALGVDFFTPIINPPQVAIVGIGRVTERKTMYLNLSFDHQVVDGAPAARFLQSIKRYLELPVALVAQIDPVKALVRVPGGVKLCDQPEPVPGAGEVLVAVHSCGICGSDVHAAEFSAGRVDGIPGHEFSGTVAQVGPDVYGLEVGQAVAVNPLGGCGECEWCQHQLFIRCANRPNLGLNAPGGFAELVAAHQSQVFPLPEGMPLEYGSRVEPLAVGLRAVVEAGSPSGLNAIVFGVGPIGLHLIEVLRAWGANTVVAVGRSSAGRRAAAATVGADVVLDSRETDVADYVSSQGIDVAQAYECSADPAALNVLSKAVRVTGTIVAVALGHSPSVLDTHRFVAKGLRMVSACAYGNRDFGRALDLIATGAVDLNPLITERIGFEAGPEAFVRLRKPGNLVSVLVQPWRT